MGFEGEVKEMSSPIEVNMLQKKTQTRVHLNVIRTRLDLRSIPQPGGEKCRNV